MKHWITRAVSGIRKWRTEDRLAVVGIVLTLLLGGTSFLMQRTLAGIDIARHQSEDDDGRAVDFVMNYFAATCEKRAELSDFPLTQWMNWTESDTVKVYRLAGKRDIHVKVWAGDPAPVMASTQEKGDGGPKESGVEQLRRDQEARDAARSGLIRDAQAAGYRLAYGELVKATDAGPVTSNCLGDRTAGTEVTQPEIPTEIVKITPVTEHRTRIVVRVVADNKNSDHVVDKQALYSMSIVHTDHGTRLKSMVGLTVHDPNADMLREVCTLLKAQIELSPGYAGYSKDGKAGVAAKCDPDIVR